MVGIIIPPRPYFQFSIEGKLTILEVVALFSIPFEDIRDPRFSSARVEATAPVEYL